MVPPARPILGLMLAACLTLFACGDGDPAHDSTAEPSARAAAGTPVILISIDTLRADRLPIYGYTQVETPAIDALRRDAVLFERAYSPAPLTLPAHASLLTGRLPNVHGLRDNLGYTLGGELPYLPELLQQHGYATGAGVSALALDHRRGLGRGFDLFDDAIELGENSSLGGAQRSGHDTLLAIEPWLVSVAEAPLFLFFHLYEPHLPYSPPEPFASRYADAYDGEVAAADQVVGALLERLRSLGLYERSLIVLLADHGEGLGDHGEEEHGVLLYRESLQVPLLIKLPDADWSGSSISQPVALTDLAPTLLGFLGIGRPTGMDGLDLLSLPLDGNGDNDADPGADERSIFSETYYPRIHFGWSELVSVIAGRYHYISGPAPELFDLTADPAETHNIVLDDPRLTRALHRRIEEYGSRFDLPGAIDDESRAALESLGYLGSTAADRDGPRADPRSRLPTLADLQEGFRHFRGNDFAAAADAFERVLANNPGMLDATEYLGLSLFHLGRFDDALSAYRSALEITDGDPDLALEVTRTLHRLDRLDEATETLAFAAKGGSIDPELNRRLALSLAADGRPDEALELLAPEIVNHDPTTLAALGRILSEAGRQSEAREVLERALAGDPRLADAHRNLALVLLRMEDWQGALDSAGRAVEIDPGLADAWNDLGVARFYTGDRQAAIAAWEEAVRLDSTLFDTLFNLGRTAPPEIARPALERFLAAAPPERYSADLTTARELLRRLDG